MAFHRSGAPDAALAQPIGQPVDQGRQTFLDRGVAPGVEPGLAARSGLHGMGGEGHDLDAEARIDGLELRREQLGDAPRIAAGQRQADGKRHGLAVQPMEAELEAPRPVALGLQPGAEFGGDVGCDPGHVLRRADRLGEGQAGEPGRRRAAEGQRLALAAERLVQPGQRRLAEPSAERRAGDVHDLAQPAQAQPLDLRPGLALQPQRRGRQGRQEPGLLAGRGNGFLVAKRWPRRSGPWPAAATGVSAMEQRKGRPLAARRLWKSASMAASPPHR